MDRFRLACIQLNSGDDMAANIARASELIRAARRAGADVIATPENTGLMESSSARVVAGGRPESTHPALAAFRALAAETGAWLLIGSLWIRNDGAERVTPRSYLIAADGAIAARYDKIHMFDVDLPTGETYRESRSFAPGAEARIVDTPFGRLGMTICYDVRFPQLYRHLAQAGAELISVPAAFTYTTGRAHWHVLVRARAIETGAYVFAPAQCGRHPGGRRTFGHSLIVGPWGEVLADGGDEVGYVIAEIDRAAVARARAGIPAWGHERDFAAAPPAPERAAE
jgi:predicted amidohydrolase